MILKQGGGGGGEQDLGMLIRATGIVLAESSQMKTRDRHRAIYGWHDGAPLRPLLGSSATVDLFVFADRRLGQSGW